MGTQKEGQDDGLGPVSLVWKENLETGLYHPTRVCSGPRTAVASSKPHAVRVTSQVLLGPLTAQWLSDAAACQNGVLRSATLHAS